MDVKQQWNEFLDEVDTIIQAMADPCLPTYMANLRDRPPSDEDTLIWAKDYVMFNTWALKYMDRLCTMQRGAEAKLLAVMMEMFVSTSMSLEREPIPDNEFTKTTPF